MPTLLALLYTLQSHPHWKTMIGATVEIGAALIGEMEEEEAGAVVANLARILDLLVTAVASLASGVEALEAVENLVKRAGVAVVG